MKEPLVNFQKYSKGIDGLRAFAVIAVIVNHFNNNILQSGYLGVDIFFVISGYVITNSLVIRSEKDACSFFFNFYKRRLKRLLPAILFCFSITAVLISFFCKFPNEYIITGLCSIFGLANINLYLNSINYWSESSQYNPFTHTWSLGVEEQFYFIFPILLWFFIRGNWTNSSLKKLKIFLVFASLISVLIFIYSQKSYEMLAYYGMPFRFWEIGLGCIMFLQFKLTNASYIKKLASHFSLNIFFFFLLLILVCPKDFAPISTICITILTTIIIALIKILENQPSVGTLKILTNKVIVYIGKISFSLYLWHWVIITISKWTIGTSGYSILIQLILIFSLSIFSYHVIEQPLRHSIWRASFRPKLILTTLFGVSFFFAIISTSKQKGNSFYLGKESSKYGELIKLPPNEISIPKISKIRILGNSHSLHIIPMIDAITRKFNIELIYDMQHLDNLIPFGDKLHIYKFNSIINSLKKNDLLILSSRNRYLYQIPYLSGKGDRWIDYSQTKINKGYGLDNWLDELDEVISITQKKGINVILFLPNIEFDSFVEMSDLCSPQWFRKRSPKCNQVVTKEFLNSRFPEKFYTEVQNRVLNESNFFAFNTFDIYCPDHKSKNCSIYREGIRLFLDTNHLTVEGSLIMLDEFFNFLIENKLI